MLSFWEKQTLSTFDFAVVGAGIMGCSVAYELRKKYPDASIIILERGIFPSGATTKNAGFMCFGSPTEILSDIKLLGEKKALEIVAQRYEGLQILKERFDSKSIGRTDDGGYELIFDEPLPQKELDRLNESLMPFFKTLVFADVSNRVAQFGFSTEVKQLIGCALESQIDSGKLMRNYWKLMEENNIRIITGADVKNISGDQIEIYNNPTGVFTIQASQIILAVNAFIKNLLPEMPVFPGRGQVLITKEIPGLKIKGSFHFDEGYYYFRNVGNRVLIGGGRNMDFKGEETMSFERNENIIQDIIQKLQHIILPGTPFEIEDTWQGIMGFSETKSSVIMSLNDHSKYVMSCNGMGIALSPFVARVLVSSL